MNGSIAIVGMSCVYPEARNPAELWTNVLAQRRAFRRIPDERLRADDYLSADPLAPDRTYVAEAAVIEGYEFDRVAFRVVGSTYRSADPAHWLALDVASRALTDAGFGDGDGLDRDTTGVVLGNTLTGEFSRANILRLRWPYVRRVLDAALGDQGWDAVKRRVFLEDLEAHYKAPFPPVGEETLAGGLSNTIAGRICNQFNFKGGGYTVDGACASSLLAVANACSALAAGDLDTALAGGVDLSLDPFEIVGFAKTGALAPESMRVYDTRSAGFWPGEGCGFVVLMRHADAVAKGCRIYATIRGWGISSDGTGGITRPEVDGQLEAIRRAYRRAGYGPDTVGYFEGHGTGTAVGDATELQVLSRARRESNAAAFPAAIGSVKANIGHTKAAAGVAGLLKAIMAVHEQVLPPTTGCETPASELQGDAPALRVLSEPEPWPSQCPIRAAVSAMGFGGVNAHITLEGAPLLPLSRSERGRGPGRGGAPVDGEGMSGEDRPPLPSPPLPRREEREKPGAAACLTPHQQYLSASVQDAEIFLFRAADDASLRGQLERVLAFAARLSRAELADLAHELQRRLQPGSARAAVVASSPAELVERLGVLIRPEPEHLLSRPPGTLSSAQSGGEGWGEEAPPPRLGFLFPGQASPANLSGGAHRRRFADVRELYSNAGFPAHSEGVATEVAQPAIVTASLAGLRMLRALGIEAAAAVGHSLGELSALHWAGVFDEAALLRIARARGRAMAELGSPTGAMAAIAARAGDVQPLLDDRVSIVGHNSPCQTVVAGEAAAVAAVIGRAHARSMRAVKLAVSHAFHTPLVGAAAPELERHLAHEPFALPERAVFSTVTGSRLSPSEDLRRLLTRQVTSSVRFLEALAAADPEVDCWIEVGPGHVLTGLAADCGAKPAFALDAGGASLKPFLETVAALFSLGATMNTAALFAGRFTRPFDLDWRPKFFVNPCELAPVRDVSSLAPSDGARGDRPRQSHNSPLSPALSPSEGPRENRSPLDLVRQLVAERAELPATAIQDDSRLLGDLHLNSISVGQLVAEAARRLGLAPLVGLNEFANATVARVATALEELVRSGGLRAAAEKPRAPAGIEAWIRRFRIDWIEKPLPARPPAPGTGDWEILAPAGHPLAELLREPLAVAGGRGVVVCLPPSPDEDQVPRLLEAARKVMAGRGASRLVIVQQGWGAGGFARTLHLEMPEVVVGVVNVPFDHPRSAGWVRDEALAATGFVEASYDSEGIRREPRLLLEDDCDTSESVLGPGDVLLVTGGGKGIAAECALALGRRTGVRLALLGRAHPAQDAELADNLERFSAAGLRCRYFAADVTDRDAVQAAVDQAEHELGRVTAVLHGAGTNVPQLLDSLDEAAFLRTLAPKTHGLRNVLAAVQADRLRALVTFGSIIGRAGLPGEADYALANEWQTALTQQFQDAHPECRCMALEWSVWSGVGMGQRLGRIETLMQQGITPIPPDEGVEMLCRLLEIPRSRRQKAVDRTVGAGKFIESERESSGLQDRAELELNAPQRGHDVAVVVTGRFGDLPTLTVEKPELPFLRFLEQVRVFFPGVELVADATLSAGSDPYLEDHVYHGERLLPAVMGLEAMAQAAMAVTGIPAPPSFENIEWIRPIVVPRNGKLVIRLAALVRGPGLVEVVVRTEETGFVADHFKAICRFGAVADDATVRRTAGEIPGLAAARLPMETERDVYQELLFHTGRFRRLRGYRHLRAQECLAEIEPDGDVQWFGRYLPAGLVLGDAGARDAGIHCIQACIPHARLLPIGVERIELGGAPCLARAREQLARTEGTPLLLLHARERRRDQETFIYDLELLSCDGCVLERWVGLRLRAVEPMQRRTAWPAVQLGPYLERRVGELIPGADVSVVVEGAAQATPTVTTLTDGTPSPHPSPPLQAGERVPERREQRSDAAMQVALESPWPIRRRPDGKPDAAGGRAVSASHAGTLTLAVAGSGPLGCDLEPVAGRAPAVWQDLLGAERFCLAGLIAAEAGEAFDVAATRVWAAGECLKKAGGMVDAPLVLDATKPDGWVVLSSGHWNIATCAPTVRDGDVATPMAVAVLAGRAG